MQRGSFNGLENLDSRLHSPFSIQLAFLAEFGSVRPPLPWSLAPPTWFLAYPTPNSLTLNRYFPSLQIAIHRDTNVQNTLFLISTSSHALYSVSEHSHRHFERLRRPVLSTSQPYGFWERERALMGIPISWFVCSDDMYSLYLHFYSHESPYQDHCYWIYLHTPKGYLS